MHVGVVLPGAGYRPDHPLLWFARAAMRQAGAEDVLVEYAPHGPLDDLLDLAHPFYERVRHDVADAIATATQVTFVAKSLGTLALGEVVRAGIAPAGTTRAMWLTPIWEHDPTYEAARTCTWRSTYAVGTADPTYRPDRHAALDGRTVVVEGGDHALQVDGDVLASTRAVHDVTAAMVELLRGHDE